MSSITNASQEDAAIGDIQVEGNVAGDIIVGSHNVKVNTNYGTLIYHAPHEPLIKRLVRRLKKHAGAGQINREGT